MHYYKTATEALSALSAKGYTTDFSVLKEEDCIYCHDSKRSLPPEEFVIDEIHRFEGNSDPGDEMIIYAISSAKHQIKGFLVSAFGPYADSAKTKIVERLKIRTKIN